MGLTSTFVFGRIGGIGEWCLVGGGGAFTAIAGGIVCYYSIKPCFKTNQLKKIQLTESSSDETEEIQMQNIISDNAKINFVEAHRVTYDVSKTYTARQKENGILDFARGDNQYAYVADGREHDFPHRRAKLVPFWEEFDTEIVKMKAEKPGTLGELKQKIKKFLITQSNKILNNGVVNSKFSSVWLVSDGDKKNIIVAHVGDTSLYKIAGDQVTRLTPEDPSDAANNSDLGSDIRSTLFIRVFSVGDGDKIIGVSDGITNNFKDDAALFEHLKKSYDAEDVLNLPQIIAEDDIAAFVMVI